MSHFGLSFSTNAKMEGQKQKKLISEKSGRLKRKISTALLYYWLADCKQNSKLKTIWPKHSFSYEQWDLTKINRHLHFHDICRRIQIVSYSLAI
jgi:hypothetical protein